MAAAKNAKQKAPEPQPKPGKKGAGGYAFSLFGLILLGLMIFAAPALFLFVVGCIPALVAFIIDREPGRNAALTVAAANVAGVAPFVVELLMRGPTMVRAMGMLSDVFVIAVMFGAAAIGWGRVIGMPKVAAVYIEVTNETKIKLMRREQQRLVEEWGEEITAPSGS